MEEDSGEDEMMYCETCLKKTIHTCSKSMKSCTCLSCGAERNAYSSKETTISSDDCFEENTDDEDSDSDYETE